MNETTPKIKPLKGVSYEQFKEFLDSLDEERKSWSLDLQHHKNDKEFYENTGYAIVCIYNDKVIGFCGAWAIDLDLKIIEVSFVVKKDYQGQGIGTMLLKKRDWDAKIEDVKYITAKHYKDNIASHKAFLKAGYEEWTFDKITREDCAYFYRKEMVDDTFDWKIKEIV